MERRRFARLVRQAVEELPLPFCDWLENIDVVVEPRPSRREIRAAGLAPDEALFGLYQGVPLTERESYGMVLPDKISIYQEPLEEEFPDEAELVQEIRQTVLHELAHHFGMSDEHLEELGLG
jgi:predicted Zn-dependent protease with MMP-like domain